MISWITIVWSMEASACLTLAIVHLVVWFKQPVQRAYLMFSLVAISVAAIAACELLAMRARTTEQFGRVLGGRTSPYSSGLFRSWGLCGSISEAGRPWLAYLVCGLPLLALIINFFSVPNLNYKEITGLRHLTIWGGETISVAEGVRNPWTRLGELSSLLLLIFVADAAVTLWRRGRQPERHRALVVGGSITFFILLAAGHSGLVERRSHPVRPTMISFAFLAIVATMGYELSSDMLRATQLAGGWRRAKLSCARASNTWTLPPALQSWPCGRGTFREMRFGARTKAARCSASRSLGQNQFCPLCGFGASRGSRKRSAKPWRRRWTASANMRANTASCCRTGRCVGSPGAVERIRWRQAAKDARRLLDISRRKQSELEAARQRSELAHLSHESLLGELSGSLAHELNQPLTAILSNAQAAQRFLAQNAADPAELQEILKDIVEDDKRAEKSFEAYVYCSKKARCNFGR